MKNVIKNSIHTALITLFFALLFTNPFTNDVKASVEVPVAPANFNATINSLGDTICLSWEYDMSVNPYVDGFIIYKSTSLDGEYTYFDDTYSSSTTTMYSMSDYDVEIGVTYYYKIVAYVEVFEDFEYYDTIYSPEVFSNMIQIPIGTTVLQSVTSAQSHSMILKWTPVSNADGYYIYRSNEADNGYTLIYTYKNTTTFDDWYFDFFEDEDELLSYTDKNLIVGNTYYYKVCPFIEYNGQVYIGSFSNIKYDIARINYAKIKKSSSKKKSTNTISWKKVSEANGYIVYFSKKYNGKYKKLKTIKGHKKLTYTHKKLKNGVAYYYKVYAYQTINGKKVLSNEPEAYEKYCDYYTYAAESWESKQKRIFGKKNIYKYKSNKQAQKNMKTIKIKVWDINSKGKKYTRTFSITVHKNLAPSIKKMFKEIYKSKERFPIHDIGCFSWRGDSSTSEHCNGTALDINSNENYMIDSGQILAGSFWKPKKSPYSIPLNCDLVKILEKYGFYRGFWGDRKDYMHFSYFGG